MSLVTQGLGIGGTATVYVDQKVTGQVADVQPVTGTVTTDTITGEVS